MTETGVRRLVAGNWKMHGGLAALDEARQVAEALARRLLRTRVAICPPTVLLERMASLLAGTPVLVGGQDCRPEAEGAFTGDCSAEMLADVGARLVIIGHSERRSGYGESDAVIAAKVEGALRAGLEPIVCIGETIEERQDARALEVVGPRLAACLPDALAGRDFAVAYEPVWAIGTGLTPTLDEIAEMHAFIREALAERFGADAARAPVLYGGSVKPTNAPRILAIDGVDGALVGGASLRASEFLPIIEAAG